MSYYKLFVPKQAVGANLVYFDFFNLSTSGVIIQLESVIPVVSGAVAVTGVVGVDLLLTRTTAVGTGGTAATFEGTDTTAMTICHQNGDSPLTSAQVSARLTPTGGATAGAVLAWRCVFPEETNAGTYTQVANLVKGADVNAPPVTIKYGTGIRVVQGAVASVGNIGFDVAFRVRPR
jgi:hypothetical protein